MRYLLANDVAKLKTPGKALYTGMLNASGGVIDDLIVYYFTEEKPATLSQHAEPYAIDITVRDDLSLIAVQGPNARAKAASLFSDEQRKATEGMKPFFGVQAGICLSPPPATPVKRATKLPCQTRRPLISGVRWWRRA